MLSALTARLETVAAGWSRRRLGADAKALELGRRRIYILPTRYGIAFAALVFAMLLGSLNYGANLGFALTFLLTGLGFVTMHECHGNLLGLRLKFTGVEPVFAGETARFRFVLVNESARTRCDIEVRDAGEPEDMAAHSSCAFVVRVPTRRRGWLGVPRFAIETRHPAQLFRAWTWLHMDARCLVYPAPAPPGRPLPAGGYGGDGARTRPGEDDVDFAGLNAATPGDPPQRLAWKAYARSGELLVKQFASGDRDAGVLDWDVLPDLEAEERLSQLARWCLDAHAELRAFGLRLPGNEVPLGRGDAHLHACLSALAELDTGRHR